MVIGQGASSPNFVFKDNILANNEYGLNCQSAQPCWPNLVQSHNVILDNRSSPARSAMDHSTVAIRMTSSPRTRRQLVWVDTSNANYALAANSPFRGRASDGTDPGVNMTALLAALGGQSPDAHPDTYACIVALAFAESDANRHSYGDTDAERVTDSDSGRQWRYGVGRG